MNKMTILFFVFFVALLSFGTRVYAQEKKDSVKVEQSVNDKAVNKDTLLRAQVDSLQATIKTMNDSFMEMQQDKKIFSFLTVKNAVIILLCVVIILLLLQILTLSKLADKVSKRRLSHSYDELKHKIEKVKEDVTWNNVQASNKRQDDRRYQPTQQKKDPYADQRPPVSSKEKEQPKKDEQKKQEKPKHVERTIYCSNNQDDLFIETSESKTDMSTFIIEYDPEDKSNNGVLSYIGSLSNLKTMNPKSREEAFKILSGSCALAEASDFDPKHVGKVIKIDGAWRILNAIEIMLKK